MSQNILYLSYDGMTDPLGQSQVLPYIIGLTKYGYKFSLISFEKLERFESQRAEIEKICRENNIDWSPLIYTKNPPILSTIYDLTKLFATIFRLHKKIIFALFIVEVSLLRWLAIFSKSFRAANLFSMPEVFGLMNELKAEFSKAVCFSMF